MRKRFKISRIASSDNYKLSRKIHIQYLKKEHIANIESIIKLTANVIVTPKCNGVFWKIN